MPDGRDRGTLADAGHYRLHAQAGPALREKSETFYREGLDRCAEVAKTNPYGIGVPFIWCSNNLLVALVTQGQLYESIFSSLKGVALRRPDAFAPFLMLSVLELP